MNFWDIFKLLFELFGIWVDIRKSKADRHQLVIDALKVAQNRASLALSINDSVHAMREELTKEMKEKSDGDAKLEG